MATISPAVSPSLPAFEPQPGSFARFPGAGGRAVPGFGLFILLNATLFIKPGEIVPGLQDIPLYLIVIIPCLLLAFPAIIAHLASRSLQKAPITVCVLGMMAAVLLSHISRFDFEGAATTGLEFAKVVAYFLLLVAVVSSFERLRIFLMSFTLFALGLTIIAVLQYHGLHALKDVMIDKTTGLEVSFLRLQGTGNFKDPNDLCLVLTVGAMLALYWAGDRRQKAIRFLWLGAFLLFGYALALTQSRGGFLAFVAGIVALMWGRFGLARTLLLGALVLPIIFVIFGGRQTEISATQSTGKTRVEIWREGIVLLKDNPIFGIGKDQYEIQAGEVAHNSFLHGFTELGLVGGMFFLGAYFFAFRALARLGPWKNRLVEPEWRRLHPYMLAVVAAYATGMMTLSVGYLVPTYMILGLVACFLRFGVTWPPLKPEHFDGKLFRQMALASVVFLAAMYGFVTVVLRA